MSARTPAPCTSSTGPREGGLLRLRTRFRLSARPSPAVKGIDSSCSVMVGYSKLEFIMA